ncbi:response regulator transcription factor [Halioxenophilus aromaticivorans]|uniref:Response regulator n=1 Tax=Halioxenophilus aromaticivorans TaxID=1306992 RepID=A0AAV3U5Q3_9ALTE
MAKQLILVEDDKRLSELVSTYLTSEGFDVTTLYSGDNAVSEILSRTVDLVILDLMLPGMSGLEICRRLRTSLNCPIVMLTAQDDDFTEVSALNTGVDDYIIKPFRPHILLARINVLLRRCKEIALPPSDEFLIAQDLRVNVLDRSITKAGQPVDVTDAEFDLLVLLMKNAGSIVERDTLFNSLRGLDYNGTDRSVDQRVSMLRRKLGDHGQASQYIRTVRGKGYLFARKLC